jgi:hypothetical protein
MRKVHDRERTATQRKPRETPDLARARRDYFEARAASRKARDILRICERQETLALAELADLPASGAGDILRGGSKS